VTINGDESGTMTPSCDDLLQGAGPAYFRTAKKPSALSILGMLIGIE
jgi:hypothetical protein